MHVVSVLLLCAGARALSPSGAPRLRSLRATVSAMAPEQRALLHAECLCVLGTPSADPEAELEELTRAAILSKLPKVNHPLEA